MYEQILVPVDLGDKHSWRKAIPTAVTLCEAFDANLIVMTVIPDVAVPVVGQYLPHDYQARIKDQVSAQLKAFVQSQIPPGIETRLMVGVGRIYHKIVAFAAKTNADLIIMGSNQPELKEYLLGPNAERVMRHARTSVMVVRD